MENFWIHGTLVVLNADIFIVDVVKTLICKVSIKDASL